MCADPPAGEKTQRLPTPVQIGNRSAHLTHPLLVFRGLVYCVVCGNVGAQRLNKLAAPCRQEQGSKGRHGRDSLARLGRGQLPKKVLEWRIYPYRHRPHADTLDIHSSAIAHNVQHDVQTLHLEVLQESILTQHVPETDSADCSTDDPAEYSRQVSGAALNCLCLGTLYRIRFSSCSNLCM